MNTAAIVLGACHVAYMVLQCADEHTHHGKRQAQSQRYSRDQAKPKFVKTRSGFSQTPQQQARTAVVFA